MMKKAIVEIGYSKYAMSAKDAMLLMQIAERAVLVEQDGYRGPYYPKTETKDYENTTFASSMEMKEFIDQKPVKVIPESHQLTDQTTRALPAPEGVPF